MTWHKRQAKKLQKKGIATMFIDHFTARDQLGSTAGNQFTVNIWSQFLDPFIALEYLSKNPKINIKKVGIQGGSRGGMVSILASEKRLRDALISKDLYFAAAQPLYPDCEDVGMFRNPQPTKETKTWMILGGADNYTRAEPCVELGKKIKANGGDIIVDVKKGWHHDFIGNYEVENMDYAQIFWKCPKWYTEDNGKMSKSYMDFLLEYVDRWKTEEDFYKMSKEDPLRTLKFSYDAYTNNQCMFEGARGGGDKGKQIFNKNIKFWEENLLK
jgi:dienelactone hydrolase